MKKLILASLAVICAAGATTVLAQSTSRPLQASADAPRAKLAALPMTGAATVTAMHPRPGRARRLTAGPAM